MIQTISILNNAQGGKRISILKTGNYQLDKNLEELCNSVSKGLYIWTHIGNIQIVNKDEITSELQPYIISENENSYFIQRKDSWLKPGQYGENTSIGIKPIDTINSYSSGQQDEIVIIDIFLSENPYKIEQEAWHQNPIFSSRKSIDGFGTEKISAPISEIRSELNKIIQTSKTEKFNEKSISVDIRNGLFDKVVESLSNTKKSTFAYLLHMRFAKTGFTLQLVHQLGNYDRELVFLLFADDYTVYGSYRDWIEKKKCWGDDIKFIDAGQESIEDQIQFCRNNNIIPFIKVGSKTTESKIEYLKNIQSNKKVMFVEEADFGAWTTNNRKRSGSLDSDIVILESGTGLNKVSFDRKLDHLFVLDIVDARLIKNGKHPNPEYQKYKLDYKNFPDVKFYDINFSLAIQKLQNKLDGTSKTGLNKMFKNVDANGDFILSFFKSVLCIPDIDNIESFDFFNKRQKSFGYKDDITGNVSLISLSPGLRNKDLKKLQKVLLSDKLISKNFEIMILNGDVTSREQSEKYTRGRLNEFKNSNKSVLIIASNMGKRSYSISEIKNVFLMYDAGSEDASGQIIARGSTEGYQYDGSVKSSYNVISCSINPNREIPSVIDLFIINNIANTFNRFNLTTEESTSLILGCFPLTIVDENGIEFNNVDFKDFIKRNPKSQMYIDAAKAGIDLDLLPDSIKEILENSGLKHDFITSVKSSKLDLKDLKTKLSQKKKQNNSNKNQDKEDIEKSIKIIEALIVLIESSFNIKCFSDLDEKSFSIIKTLDEIISENLSEDFIQEFGINPEICKFVLETGVIDEKLINAGVDEIIIETELYEL